MYGGSGSFFREPAGRSFRIANGCPRSSLISENDSVWPHPVVASMPSYRNPRRGKPRSQSNRQRRVPGWMSCEEEDVGDDFDDEDEEEKEELVDADGGLTSVAGVSSDAERSAPRMVS